MALVAGRRLTRTASWRWRHCRRRGSLRSSWAAVFQVKSHRAPCVLCFLCCAAEPSACSSETCCVARLAQAAPPRMGCTSRRGWRRCWVATACTRTPMAAVAGVAGAQSLGLPWPPAPRQRPPAPLAPSLGTACWRVRWPGTLTAAFCVPSSCNDLCCPTLPFSCSDSRLVVHLATPTPPTAHPPQAT